MNLDEIKQKIQTAGEDFKLKVSDAVAGIKEKLPPQLGGGRRERNLEDEIDEEFEDGEYYDEDEEYEDEEEVDFDDETGEMTPTGAVRKARGTDLGLSGDATAEIDIDATGELTGEFSVEEEEYEDDEEYEEGEEEVDEKVAQRQKIIKGVVILGLVYLGLDMLTEDDSIKKAPKGKQQVSQKKKAGKRKSKKSKSQQKQAAKNQDKQEEIKEISVSKNTGKVQGDPQEVKPPVIPSIEETSSPDTDTQDVVEEKPAEPTNITDTYIDDPNSQMKDEGFQAGRKEGQIINNKVPTKIKEINISNDLSKILNETKKQVEQNVEYIAPPDYTKFGRGLVYNCKGKHWACIDRTRWFECKNNLKYTNFYGKDKECVTVNVYGNQKDCRVMQLHNINTNTETNFCR